MTDRPTAAKGGSTPAPSEPADPRRPLHRNPWFWGIIACLLYPPLVRPLTRHIPDPPEVGTRLGAEFSATDSNGASFALKDLEGQVHIGLAVFEQVDKGKCPATIAALAPLAERLETQAEAGRGCASPQAGFGDHLRLLLAAPIKADQVPDLVADCNLTGNRWAFVTDRAAAGFVGRLIGAGRHQDRGGSSDHPLTIVDETGGLRGVYSLDEVGLDEVYHRARHVLREQR